MNRRVLIALLAVASAFMVYRLLFMVDDGASGAGGQATQTGNGGNAAGKLLGGRNTSRQSSGRSGAAALVDPSLRLDLLSNSRAVSYTGSKRNIFVMGASAAKGGAADAADGGKSADPQGGAGADASGTPSPPPPPPPPPVVIPLKFYGIAEKSGGASTKALLTSGETILIAQVGQTVAQHFKILRIGLTKLELEDTRDHSNHEIPLEDGSPTPAAAPAAGGAKDAE